MPKVDYAEYKTIKDKVVAKVTKQGASAFTKLAKQYEELDKELSILEAKKRELNEFQNSVKDKESSLKSQIREKIQSVFDESEQAMTLTVECLGSAFTLSKETENNREKVITKSGEIISTDYQKVINLLLEQTPELKSTIDLLIKKASVIAENDITKAGTARGVRISAIESIVTEGIWDKITSIANKISSKLMGLFSALTNRQKKINILLGNLKESKSEKPIMLNKREKELVKEYARKIIEKRK